MRPIILALCFACASALLSAQKPDSVSTTSVINTSDSAKAVSKTFEFKDDAGASFFSYTYPSDWITIDSKPIMPALRMKVEDGDSSAMEKKGVDCTQVPLLLRSPQVGSSIVVVALPYACIGPVVTENDLPGAALGVSEGMKKNFDIADAAYGAYKLGKHGFWVERAHGTSKSHPETSLTLEIACTMLKKAMVCWMGFSKDQEALQVFESGQTSLEGDPPLALVPATAFNKSK
jgi:hypothetical protein